MNYYNNSNHFPKNIAGFPFFMSIIFVSTSCGSTNKARNKQNFRPTRTNIDEALSGANKDYTINSKKLPSNKARNIIPRIKAKYMKSITVFGRKKNDVRLKLKNKKKAFNDLINPDTHSISIRDSIITGKKLILFLSNPLLKGGIRAFERNMQHIKGCDRKGLVTVNFKINKKGVPTNIKIAKGLDFKCNEIAIKTVKRYVHFIPDTRNGKPIEVPIYLLTLRFQG
jgi:hypothetical protein